MKNTHNTEILCNLLRDQVAANQRLVEAITQLTRIPSSETSLRPMKEGHVTLDELYKSTNGAMSKDTFKSLLRGACWPRCTYEKALECGRVVELGSFSTEAKIRGQQVTAKELVSLVLIGATQITKNYYEHPLVTGRFRINR